MEGQEELTMDGLLESFGLNGGSTNDDQSNEKPAEQAASAPAEEGSQTKETSQTSEPAEQKTETPPPEQKPATLEPQQTDKSAAAFAEMRTRLKEQEDLLKELGKTLGIEGDAKAVVAKLKSIQTEKQAKQAGVPPEIMQRLQALEAEKAERAEQDRKVAVYNQIGHFQKTMGLSQADTMDFLRQLAAAGKNPFEKEIDLKSEYIVLNFERLQKEAVQKALEDQAKRDQHANEHSSTPTRQTGAGEPPQSEIKTVDDLTGFLRANVK